MCGRDKFCLTLEQMNKCMRICQNRQSEFRQYSRSNLAVANVNELMQEVIDLCFQFPVSRAHASRYI